MNLSQDDLYLIKLKNLRLSNSTIAAKLGISSGAVEKRWSEIQAGVQSEIANGHAALCNQYTIMAHQFQLLGESLKIIASGLSDAMTAEEVRKLVVSDPDQTVQNLLKSCIILRPFSPVDPIQSLEEHTKKIQEEN